MEQHNKENEWIERPQSWDFFTTESVRIEGAKESLTTIIFMIMAIQLLGDRRKPRGREEKLWIMKYCTIAYAQIIESRCSLSRGERRKGEK